MISSSTSPSREHGALLSPSSMRQRETTITSTDNTDVRRQRVAGDFLGDEDIEKDSGQLGDDMGANDGSDDDHAPRKKRARLPENASPFDLADHNNL